MEGCLLDFVVCLVLCLLWLGVCLTVLFVYIDLFCLF